MDMPATPMDEAKDEQFALPPIRPLVGGALVIWRHCSSKIRPSVEASKIFGLWISLAHRFMALCLRSCTKQSMNVRPASWACMQLCRQ